MDGKLGTLASDMLKLFQYTYIIIYIYIYYTLYLLYMIYTLYIIYQYVYNIYYIQLLFVSLADYDIS